MEKEVINIINTDIEMKIENPVDNENMDENLVNAKELKDWAESNPQLQVIKIDTPIDNYDLFDIRIKNRNKEDDLFLHDREIYKRIRRGNCIAEYILDKQPRFKFARKGLIKFFDYLKFYKNKFKKEEKIVLDPIKKLFNSSDAALYVYLSEKANGENAQIAYEPVVNAWIVGSKNVSIVVRTRDDIEWYLKDKEKRKKFSYCAEFAYLWFETLEKEIKSKSEGNYDNFINDILGYTLIAENCGDVTHQHIKLYTEKSLIFYGMIKNDSLEISTPISHSIEILQKKYGLSFVSIEKSPLIKSYPEFISYMAEVYTDILKRDVEIGGEGSVAYFTAINLETGVESVISMGKLKTFEYRFLRKLREKLKIYCKKKGAVDSVLTKIEAECNDLLGEDGDELDLSEWMKFAKFVLNFVKRNPGKNDDFTNLYATFINEMKSLYIKENEGNLKITDEVIQSVCEKYKPAEIIINEDEVDDDEGFIQVKKGNFQKIQPDEKEVYLSRLATHASKPFRKGQVYFFLGSTLVGGGKSTLFSIIEKLIVQSQDYSELINLNYVSSDKMKGELIQEYLKNNPLTTQDEAHDKISKNFKNKFNSAIITKLNETRDDNKINIMFVDKNFPGQNAIETFYTDMLAFSKKDGYEVYVFHPITRIPMKSRDYNFPFSLSNFIQSYYRIKNRKGHETLDFDKNPYAQHILIGFLSIYNNYEYKINNNRVFFYPLSFSDEKEIPYKGQDFKLFNNMMRAVKGKTFKNDLMMGVNDVISEFFDKVEADYPLEIFENTIGKIEKEMSDFLIAKVYGKVTELD